MLKNVKLTNFRGFAKLDVALSPVSVVVGPNSSGKTTILHAISAAHRAYTQALDAPDAHPTVSWGRVIVCASAVLQDHSLLLPLAIQEEIFHNGEVAEGVQTSIELTFDDADPVRQLAVRLAYMRNKVLKLTVEVDCPTAVSSVKALPSKSKHRAGRLLDELKRDQPAAVLIPAFYGVTLQEEFRPAPVVDEQLQEGQQSRIVRNLVARLSASDLEELNAFLGRTVGARIATRTHAADSERVHPLVVRFTDTNGELDLSAAGAGVVNLIALFAALKWRQRAGQGTTVFLLDEPEAHLHPRLQGDLGDELATLVRGFSNAQVVAATHSVEMINRLGRRDDAVLIAVDRTKAQSVTLSSESAVVDELSRWADLTPFVSLNFLASRRLLFHEGPSDARILTRAAEVLFRNRPAQLAAFKRWTLVPLDGTGHAPGMAALKKVIQPKVFPGLGAGDPVRLVLVLDKDRVRQPGMVAELVGKVSTTEVVWSRHSIESLFLEPSHLGQWLAACVLPGGSDEPKMRGLVAAAVVAVDASTELNDAAVADLAPLLLRDEGGTLKERIKQAQALVKQEPAVWQKGRDRARKVLEHVRNELPKTERRHVRASIVDVLEEAKIERLHAPATALPGELVALLEQLVVGS